jgi:hypothetical protein
MIKPRNNNLVFSCLSPHQNALTQFVFSHTGSLNQPVHSIILPPAARCWPAVIFVPWLIDRDAYCPGAR